MLPPLSCSGGTSLIPVISVVSVKTFSFMDNVECWLFVKCQMHYFRDVNSSSFLCAINFVMSFLWPPCVADADVIFLPCDFYLLISFFIPRLISAVADWMSTILRHMMRP